MKHAYERQIATMSSSSSSSSSQQKKHQFQQQPRQQHRKGSGDRDVVRGMPDLLGRLGLELEGRHHSGIDDCRNIGRCVSQMVKLLKSTAMGLSSSVSSSALPLSGGIGGVGEGNVTGGGGGASRLHHDDGTQDDVTPPSHSVDHRVRLEVTSAVSNIYRSYQRAVAPKPALPPQTAQRTAKVSTQKQQQQQHEPSASPTNSTPSSISSSLQSSRTQQLLPSLEVTTGHVDILREILGDGGTAGEEEAGKKGAAAQDLGGVGASSPSSSSLEAQLQTDPSLVTNISKALTQILRHGALERRVGMHSNGLVKMDDLLLRQHELLLSKRRLRSGGGVKRGDNASTVVSAGGGAESITLFQLSKYVVQPNGKDRFELGRSADGVTYIRARQGHSIEGLDLGMHRVMRAAEVPPMVIHGTNFAAWECIQHDGLRPMNRQHIHMAGGLPEAILNQTKLGKRCRSLESGGCEPVKSGMRASCDVFVFLDIDKMLRDGVPIFVSGNGVILSPGIHDDGDGDDDVKAVAGDKINTKSGARLHPRYFKYVLDRNGNEIFTNQNMS